MLDWNLRRAGVEGLVLSLFSTRWELCRWSMWPLSCLNLTAACSSGGGFAMQVRRVVVASLSHWRQEAKNAFQSQREDNFSRLAVRPGD